MRNQSVLSPEHHLTSCADWLLSARKSSGDGGYSALYSPLVGWAPGYVETTGYIIPTMFDLAKSLSRPELREDALVAADWILERQLANGAFPGLDACDRPEAFDTGQVLLGLVRLIQETNEERFRNSASRAAEWLLSVQREDGAFLTSGGLPRTYQSRVCGALYAYGSLPVTAVVWRPGERDSCGLKHKPDQTDFRAIAGSRRMTRVSCFIRSSTSLKGF